MAAPTYELVGVARARLRQFAPLTALVAPANIFSKAPASYTPPYITLDDAFSNRDAMSCVTSIVATLNVHIWTDDSHPLPQSDGALQDARRIGWEVVQALHHYSLSLPSNRLVTLAHTAERVFYDPGGVIGHGVETFQAVIEAA